VLDALNDEDLKNEDAIENLHAWKKGTSKPEFEYLSVGQRTMLGGGELIPGLKVTVLGPPGPEHWEALKQNGDSDELWKRLTGLREDLAPQLAGATNEFVEFDDSQGPYGVQSIFGEEHQVPSAAFRKDNVRWLVEQLDALRGRQLLNFVRVLDEHLNNTSLVFLFEFGGFRMLFPGDAEVAAWQMINKRAEETGDIESLAERLRTVDLYKVGHHGSENATPKLSLWHHLFESRDDNRLLHCLLSTQAMRFKGKIPNRTLYELMRNSRGIELLTTALPLDDRGPLTQPAGWQEVRSKTGDKVIAYSRTFSVNAS
jgi:hypothetical protein